MWSAICVRLLAGDHGHLRGERNLLWEIETLRPTSDRQWVFVGRDEQLQGDGAEVSGAGAFSALRDRLDRLLEGEQVLRYGDSPDEMAGFAEALRAAIR